MDDTRVFPRAAVASPHYLASAAGLEVLASGGNAVDAAVAANLTLGVVAPYLCGYGGDLFALMWHDGRAHAYLGGGRAPATATREAVAERAGEATMPDRGALTVTVPGAVRGWFDLLDRFGSRSFADLSRRAAVYAADGFPLSEKGRLTLAFLADDYREFGEWQRVYGDAAERGFVHQPDLARTIRALAEGGPDAYYRGPVAKAVAACVQEHGGLLSASDLAAHAGEWTEPLRAPYRHLEVLELPPPTQGVAALEALRMLDRSGPLPADGPERQHLMIEVVKLALADRDAHVTDPDVMLVDPGELITDAWVDERLGRVDPARANDPGAGVEIPGGTAYLCAADADGTLVSLIQTNFNEFGSGLTVPGWGINLQNRGRSFSLDPGHVNVVAPGKRTLHTLIPALALRDGEPHLVFGTMGADTQAQVHVQLLAHVVDGGLALQPALDAPRWRVLLDDWSVVVESRFGDDVVAGLEARGHRVSRVGSWWDYMGHAHAISVGPGGYAAASDRRAEGAALGL